MPNEGFSWKREENKKVKEIKEDHRNLMKRNSAIIKRKIINANRKITTSGFPLWITSAPKMLITICKSLNFSRTFAGCLCNPKVSAISVL